MCGLFAWLLPKRHARDAALLTRLTDLMQHRGPDGCGTLLKDVLNGAWQIGLGHRRLSIIDLSDGGAQPMSTPDGRLTVVFNGEIYNYLELAAELQALGHDARTKSDTEVLLMAWRQWGAEALNRLRGMFAFVLWDGATGELIVARDPFGKKPLFMMERDGGYVFASEIAPLLAFPGADRTVDPAAVGEYLLLRYVPGPHTMLRAIKKVPPGHYGIIRAGRLQLTRYFEPPVVTARQEDISFDEAVHRFMEQFQQAVRLRLRSDAPFGAFLSGGLDSSAVVAVMSQQMTQPVKTFSVGFEEAEYSELNYARHVAERFATDHSEVIVKADNVISLLPDAIRHRGAPVSESSDVPILMLSREAAKSVKMVLTGEGSDENLAGYPKHKGDGWARAYHRFVPLPLHDRLVRPIIDRLPYGARRLELLGRALGQRDPLLYQCIWFGNMDPKDVARLMAAPQPLVVRNGYSTSHPEASSLRRMLFFDQTSWLPDNLLERGDRMMMGASVEGRMPFMDRELAQTVAAFPQTYWVGAKGGKAVLRRAMRDILGPKIIERPKVGFTVPTDVWFRTSLRDFVRDLVLSDRARLFEFLDRRAVTELVESHVRGEKNWKNAIWSLINLELFLKTAAEA